MPDRVAWADMTDGSPSRGGNSPITVTDLQAARAEVAAAQLAVNAVNILEDRKAYEAVQTVLAERLATFDQISEAVKSNEAAAAVAAVAAERPPLLRHRSGRIVPLTGLSSQLWSEVAMSFALR